jgi:hypothetical protein
MFGPNVRTAVCLSEYERDGEEVITRSTEALCIVFIENAEAKWRFEAELEKKWGRALVKADRYTEDYKKKCPATLWSTKDAGNNKGGGWGKKGKERYRDVRGLIQDARDQEWTHELEEQVRAEIIKRHEDAKKKPKTKPTKENSVDLTGAVGSETVGVVDEEDCDSVAEGERFSELCEDKKLFEDPAQAKNEPEEEKKEEEEENGKKRSSGAKGGRGK